MVKIAGLDSNNEFEAESVKDHIKNLAASAVDVSGLANQVSGAVTHQTVADRLDVDLGVSVNEISEVTGPTDVYFKDVTTADGRTNPDGMGTLLVVASGAENLTWPGGTVVHGTPPEGQSALASLVRVGGTVTVVWPPTVVTSTAPGVTAQIAEIEQILGGEVEVQPGGTVIRDAQPGTNADPAVFTNPYPFPTSSQLVLTSGQVEQSLLSGDRFRARTVYRPGGFTLYNMEVGVALDASSEPVESMDGWLIATFPGLFYMERQMIANALYDISRRVANSTVVAFTDGTSGVVLQYDAENPHWQVYEWEGETMLFYNEEGRDTWWGQGLGLISDLSLPMQASESEYTSLGIKLPGTFHRAAELEAMVVNNG